MNIKELKEILNVYPEDLDVWVLCEGYGNSFKARSDDVRLEVEYEKNEKKVVLMLGRK